MARGESWRNKTAKLSCESTEHLAMYERWRHATCPENARTLLKCQEGESESLPVTLPCKDWPAVELTRSKDVGIGACI